MEIKISKSDVTWSYLGNFFQYATNLLVLPIILSNISSQNLGLWYTFASIGTLVMYLDFGFSTTLVRNITYAWSGAAEIKESGFNIVEENKVNVHFIKNILFTCKLVCLIVALVAIVIMATVGTWYVFYITRSFFNQSTALIAWGIYAFAVFLNVYYNYCANALRGIGLIATYHKIVVFSKVTQIGFTFIGIKLGYELMSLSIAYLLSGFIIRFLSKIYIDKAIQRLSNKEDNVKKHNIKSQICEAKKIFGKIWYNAKRSGTISLCSYAINQSLTLICSAYLGVEQTASYGLCLQIITAIMSISGILFATYSPRMINCIALGKNEDYVKNFSVSMCVFWIVAIFGLISFGLLCDNILLLLHSNTTIPQVMFFLMGIYMFLEHNHGEFTAHYTMRNDICYLKAYIISSLSIVLFSWFFAALGFDIYILMLVHFIIQLVYNNWAWPNKVLKEMGINILEMYRIGKCELVKIISK